jgi:AraC family transcriptional regulator, melibiose operon regulatory protein
MAAAAEAVMGESSLPHSAVPSTQSVPQLLAFLLGSSDFSSMTEHWTSLGFRVWRAEPAAMTEGHAHADIEINLVLEGGIRYQIAGQKWTVDPGQVIAFWGALPHRLDRCTRGTHGIWLTVPLGWFLGQSGTQDLVQALLTRPLMTSHPADQDRFAAWADAKPTPRQERIIRLEIETWLLHNLPDGPESPRSDGAAPILADAGDPLVTAMAATMARHHAEPLTIDDITGDTGLHPRYAMTRFRQALGVTVWEYLLRLRVAAAQGRLLGTRDDILGVALASGFGSSARFYATFRRITGMTPREYRQRHGWT